MGIRITEVVTSKLLIKNIVCGMGNHYHITDAVDDVSLGSIPLGQGIDDHPWPVRDSVLTRPNVGNLVMGESQYELLSNSNSRY